MSQLKISLPPAAHKRVELWRAGAIIDGDVEQALATLQKSAEHLAYLTFDESQRKFHENPGPETAAEVELRGIQALNYLNGVLEQHRAAAKGFGRDRA